MSKLSATDAAFIYAENPTCPMSIGSLQFMQLPPGVPVADFVKGLKTFIAARAHLVPYLTNKLEWPSGAFGHPNWVMDNDFDIDQHIYCVPVPAPGGLEQVEELVARLHATPLPRERPLWDLVVMTGLADGQVAYYNRLHHACADGMAAQAATRILMDEDPAKPTLPAPLAGHGGASVSFKEHLLGMFEGMFQQGVQDLLQAPERAAAAMRLWRRSVEPDPGLGALLAPCPKTSFNKTISPGRVFAAGELPLTGVKQIAKQLHCTINDVFLAICGSALRAYLDRAGDLPTTSLIAGCPVSLRGAGDTSANNQVAMIRVPLHTELDDPVERVLKVNVAARQAKSLLAQAAPMLPGNITAPMLGLAIAQAQTNAELFRLAESTAPAVNVVISNVPGPRKTLYSNGARMLTHYPVSVPAHGTGLNITVQSYAGRLYVGLTAAANIAPDVARLRDDIGQAYTEIKCALSAEIVDLAAAQSPDPLPETPVNRSLQPFSDRVA